MVKKYVIENPVLMAEWHWEKNNELNIKPQNVMCGTAKKAWWKCEKGHVYNSVVNMRVKGVGCPYCNGKKILKGYNDLATKNPKLAKEWHPTKNGELTPYDIAAGCNKKAWWKCEKGHEWIAVINSRNNGVGCPYCANKKVLLGYNDLETVNPKLVKEWNFEKNHFQKPQNYVAFSNKKVWWKCCKCKHEWIASINDRNRGRGCPGCAGKEVVVGVNDLATKNPKLAKEWHPSKNKRLTPKQVTCGADKKVWWKCCKGHEWQALIYDRNNGKGCPKCSSVLKTSFPEQAIYYYFSKVTQAENRFMLDSRTEIDVYLPKFNIGIEYDGLYYHSGEKAEKREAQKERKLNEQNIRLIRVKEVLNIDNLKTVENVIYTLNQYNDKSLNAMIKDLFACVNSIVNDDFKVDADISNDRNKIYELYLIAEREKSLETLNPTLANEWHPIKNGAMRPENFSINSNKKVWWLGKCGHEWQALIYDRYKGKGCPICAGKKILVGFNDLKSRNPTLASEWHPTKNENLFPENVTIHSQKKVWWLGKCGHEWQATISHRTNGRGCPACAGKEVVVGFNDLATKNPKLALEWNTAKNGELTPFNVSWKANKKVWWECRKCAYEWQAIINDRNSGNGCPVCAGNKLIVGLNDLKTLNPALAKEWHPTKNGNLTPQNVKASSGRSVWWKCSACCYEWKSKVRNRNNGGSCCKNCK